MHPTLRRPGLSRTAACLALLGSFAAAQTPATAPHWGSYFGGTLYDGANVVRKGPGPLITVVGNTNTQFLPTTPGAFQPALQNPIGLALEALDAFVARFDPTLPPSQQLLWCTYFGGSDLELALDALVDDQGFVTIVGVTKSADLPMNAANPGFQQVRSGLTDGFIARFDPTLGALLYSTYFGGGSDDWLCRIADDGAGGSVVSGVTSSFDLPGRQNGLWSTYRGGINDAFLSRLDFTAAPGQQLLWSNYVGGAASEAWPWSSFGMNTWPGNLRRQALLVDGNQALLATMSQGGAPTTPGAFQPAGAGGADAYLVGLDLGGTAQTYGSYLGGNAADWPHGIARHPHGGYVITGGTTSANLPFSPNALQTSNRGGSFGLAMDAFVSWLDPSHGTGSAQLRYSSYLGGNAGEDVMLAVAVESSGLVTLAGTAIGGGTVPFWTTTGSMQHVPATDFLGAITRLRLDGNGTADLVYSTLVANSRTIFWSLALDEVGDAIVGGETASPNFPTMNPFQASYTPVYLDAAMLYVPLLPGGTQREAVAFAVPACTAPSTALYTTTLSAPTAGNLQFAIAASNAPPLGIGTLVLGFAPPPFPLVLGNIEVLVDPIVLGAIAVADAYGFGAHAFPIPPGTAPGLAVHCQSIWLTNPACAGSGPFASSERLVFTTL